jgi:hypothetical protein
MRGASLGGLDDLIQWGTEDKVPEEIKNAEDGLENRVYQSAQQGTSSVVLGHHVSNPFTREFVLSSTPPPR